MPKRQSFTRFLVPVIEVLREIGGSGTAQEVVDLVIEKNGIPEAEQQETIKSGQSRVINQVQWARFYLFKAGYLDSPKRGIWSLTEKGLSHNLTNFNIKSLLKDVQEQINQEKNNTQQSDTQLNVEDQGPNGNNTDDSYQSKLMTILLSLPPEGFERLCQRLLREYGFQRVTVTGKSGDGGIDGIGILQINPFVSFTVLFQCKRYQGSVSSSHIRDFRGAMMGRTDKGIILTTGTFTVDAKKEARRDGVPPIELIDGEKLIDIFEKLELGLIPKKTYEINSNFFEDFK